MADSIFDIEEYIAKATIQGTSALIYGERKIGKTSLAVQYPKHFVIGFEVGWKGLNKVKAVPVKDWNHFVSKFVKPLVKEARDVAKGKKEETTYETIIIDTSDIAYDYCTNYVLSQEGVTHLDYTENKRGYKMVKQEFQKQIFALLASGYTVVFTSHAETKQVTDGITKEKTDRTIPTMDKNAFKIIGGIVDAIVYCANVEDKNGDMVRVAYFRSNGQFEAGSRWSKHLPVGVPLDFKKYEDAIVTAIEKQAEEDGVETDREKAKSLYKVAEESIEYDYDDMMAQVNRIGYYLQSIDELQVLTDTSDRLLGVGNRITDCTKMQLEVIGAFLSEMKEAMNELEIEIPEDFEVPSDDEE